LLLDIFVEIPIASWGPLEGKLIVLFCVTI